MDSFLGFGLGTIVLIIFLPQVLTTLIMSFKGYSGCLWLFLSFFLSWIGVIIALCMPNIRRKEERHKETIAAICSQNRSETIIVNNSEKNDMQDNAHFRAEAIKNLKTIGQSFDEYDVELEVENVKKTYKEKLLAEKYAKKQEEEKKRIEDKKEKKMYILIAVLVFIWFILMLI